MNNLETLTNYLEAWKARDWQAMAALTQLTWHAKHADAAAWLELHYGPKRLKSWEILGSVDISANASRFTVKVTYELRANRGFGRQQRTRSLQAMVICESAPHEPTPEGQWGVNPVSTLREETRWSYRKARALAGEGL